MGKKKVDTTRRNDNKIEPQQDSDDNNEFDKASDDESINDSASDIGWDSEDQYGFKKRKNDSSADKNSEDEEESDQEEPKMGEILLSDLLGDWQAPSKSTGKLVSTDDQGDSDFDSEVSDEEDDELDNLHDRLLTSIEKFAKADDSLKVTGKRHAGQLTQESKLSSMLNNADVSMNALLGALDNSNDLVTIKKRLVDLEKGLSVPTYVERTVSNRMERHHVYEGTKTEMNKWQDTIVENRHTKVLDLAQDKRQMASYKQIVNHHVPSTALERDIEMILVKHGTTDKAAHQIETDELESRQFNPQELRERQAELAKVKALMFYEQMKRHRMNKIKSKAYRSIHKRQQQRKNGKNEPTEDSNGEEDPSEKLDDEQRETIAYNRVKERMDMRHKNTSKWAKMALLHGHSDKNLRSAYHESVQLGRELTQRIQGTDDDTGKESLDAVDSSSADEYDVTGKSVTKTAAEEMHQLLNASGATEKSVDGKYRKLFDMDFMKKAVDQQRERAREDAESALREIAAMDDSDNASDVEEDDNNTKSVPKHSSDKKRDNAGQVTAAAAKEMIQTALSRKGQGSLMSVAGNIKHKNANISGSLNIIADSAAVSTTATTLKQVPVTTIADDDDDEVENNPWLLSAPASTHSTTILDTRKKSIQTADGWTTTASSATKKDAFSAGKPVTKKRALNMTVVTPSVSTVNSTSSSNPVPKVSAAGVATTKSALPVRAPLLMQKSQADLVKLAFAGPDLEEEFNAFKAKEIDGELGVDEKRLDILKSVKAGWGDWAGPGASAMVSQKIVDKRARLLSQVQSDNNKKKLARKDSTILNVLISERRVKTASKFKIADLPHPFTSWEQYERSLQMPLGDDWNAANVVKANTQPEIKMRAGRIIEPIKVSKKKT